MTTFYDIFSLLRKHAPADMGAARTRPDGRAAGRSLDLEGNDLVSLDANTFASLTSLE